MKKYIIIKGDMNDGDYTMEKKEITDEELEKIMPVIKCIKFHGAGYNWPSSEYCDETPEKLYAKHLSEEQIEMFSEYVPYGERGIHSIKSITILEVAKEERLL